MTREESLKKLHALHDQLLTVYAYSGKCQKLEQDIMTLTDEKLHPPQLTVETEDTDAEETLRAEFEVKNRRRIKKGWLYEGLFLLVCALALAGVAVALYCDAYQGTGFFYTAEHLAKCPEDSLMPAVSLHAVMSVVALIIAIINLVKVKE